MDQSRHQGYYQTWHEQGGAWSASMPQNSQVYWKGDSSRRNEGYKGAQNEAGFAQQSRGAEAWSSDYAQTHYQYERNERWQQPKPPRNSTQRFNATQFEDAGNVQAYRADPRLVKQSHQKSARMIGLHSACQALITVFNGGWKIDTRDCPRCERLAVDEDAWMPDASPRDAGDPAETKPASPIKELPRQSQAPPALDKDLLPLSQALMWACVSADFGVEQPEAPSRQKRSDTREGRGDPRGETREQRDPTRESTQREGRENRRSSNREDRHHHDWQERGEGRRPGRRDTRNRDGRENRSQARARQQ